MIEWTKPYYGVSHMKIPKPYQITLNELDNGKAIVYILDMLRDRNETVFTPLEEFYGTVKECKDRAVQWYKVVINDERIIL